MSKKDKEILSYILSHIVTYPELEKEVCDAVARDMNITSDEISDWIGSFDVNKLK